MNVSTPAEQCHFFELLVGIVQEANCMTSLPTLVIVLRVSKNPLLFSGIEVLSNELMFVHHLAHLSTDHKCNFQAQLEQLTQRGGGGWWQIPECGRLRVEERRAVQRALKRVR